MNIHQFLKLDSGKRQELIHGVVVDMSPMNAEHALIQEAIYNAFRDTFGRTRACFSASLYASEHNSPEPDLFLLKPVRSKLEAIKDKMINPDYVQIVVEVANTTIYKDLTNDGSEKLGIYAGAGIPCVWVIDVNRRKVHVFTSPSDGTYKEHEIFNTADKEVPVYNELHTITTSDIFDI